MDAAPTRVAVNPEALEAVERLRVNRGTLTFHQSGVCCDGTSPLCLLDAEQHARWNRPSFLVDVGVGAAHGTSLEELEDDHFITLTASQPIQPRVTETESQ